MATIGFIGLGNMGGPMAANLVKAGHTVQGTDLSAAAREGLAAAGGTAVASIGEAVHQADAVVTMLPAGDAVRTVVTGEAGVLSAARPGALLIDCSTIDVATAREVAASAGEAGHPMIDAPVSGGTSGAEAATLTFMVGGADEALANARPFLEVMGKTVVHAGGPGAGQAAKICNNMILGVSMIAVSEAFNLADALGLDRQKLFDVASRSSGQCWSLTTYCPVPGPVPTSPANRDYKPGFSAGMMLKDLTLAAEASESGHVRAMLGAAAVDIYGAFVAEGHADTDFSGIIRFLKGPETGAG